MIRILNARAIARRVFAVFAIFVLQALVAPAAQAQSGHTSTLCAAKTASVTSGGSVTINITDCAYNSGFYASGPVDGGSFGTPDFPNHGNATLRITGGQWFVDYNHNGSTGIGSIDTFEFQDGSLDGCCDALVTITITASSSPLTVSPSILPTMTAGVPFSQTLTTSGGTGPYTYSLQSGALPVGLTLNSVGILSGTPTERGVYSFSVRATDSSTPTANVLDKGYSGTVQIPSLALVSASGTAIQGAPFSQTLSTSGGVAPYSYLLETGMLPTGITLSSTGVLSGTTSAATGTYNLGIRVTESSTGPGQVFEVEPFTLTVSPPPSVSVAVSPASVSEDGATNLTYTVTRSLNLTSPTTVNITTTGTATSGTDYTGAVSTVTIPAGATTATFAANPTVDGTVEPDETVTMIVAAGAGYTVGVPSSATGTILNDDVPTATISVSPANVAEDGAPNLVYTVTLNQAAFNPISIGYTIGGTATNGTDYATIASPLVINTGSTTGTITVNPTADATIESNETVTLTLNAGAGYAVGVPNSATGNILNDDLPNLTINDVTVNEGNAGTTNATFTVSLSAPAGPGGVTFDIATANGTATAGVDYVANTLTSQTIPAGSSTYTFTVLLNGETLNEPSETYFVNVTNVVNAVVVDGQGVGTIINDDPLPSLSVNDVTVTEGNAGSVNAVFTVSLSAASGQTVTVNYATADGTATQPADYTNSSGTLAFTPGQATRTVTVPVIGETAPEANETFFLNLSGATNASISDNQGVGTITNDDVPVTISPTSIPNGTVGTAFSQTLVASGGTAGYLFSVSAGALPAGLTLSAGGTLSGTPTAGGTFNFTVTATDSSPFPGPFSGSRAYSLTIAAPTITIAPASLPNATAGIAYASTIAASGGTAPYSYALTAGALPAGLSISAASGAISGTPTATGTFNFTVTAVDASTGTGPFTGSRAYALTVLAAAPVANPVSATLAYNSGANPITLSITGGAPTSVAVATAPSHGTTIASGTSITYQPNAGYAGSDSFTYTAANSGGTSAPATVSIVVQDPVVTIAPSGGFSATVAVPYTQTFTFNGGAQPWSGFQVINLPTGLSVTGTTANTVTISGTPTQVGTRNITVAATDSSTGNGPYTVAQSFALTVAGPGLAMTPAPGTLNAPYGQAFSQTFTASGGVGPYTYALTGTLPSGLTFSNGTLSGTTTAPGAYPITVTATDTGSTGAGSPFTIAQNYMLLVVSPTITIAPASLPNPTAGSAYSQTVTASGGVGPYSYAITAGAMPGGLSLSSTGALSGSATQVGTFNFAVTATDNFGQTGTRAYSVTVAAPTLSMTPAAGPLNAPYGQSFSRAFAAAGGSGSYSYALTGTLPAGMSFSGNTVSGIPTVPGSYSITITATDTAITGVGAPFSIAQNYTIDVAAPTITVSPASLPNPVIGTAYTQNLSATGGAISYNFAITAGSLPSGIFLSGGTIAGTTYQVGTFNFTVTVTDGNGQTGSQAYTLTVAAPTYTMTPPAGLVTAPYGQPFTQAFTATGGSGTFSYAVAGALPAGLTFSNGTISGTPIAPGAYSVTITATDQTVTGLGEPFGIARNYNIFVPPPTIAVSPASLAGATVGGAYSQALSATGGVGPYSFAITAGALPNGLSLGGANLTGTPTQAGTFNLSVTATDANGQTASQAYALTVAAPPLAITPAAGTLPITYNAPFSRNFAASGGIGPYTYALTGTLPAGLTFNSATATLAGTPQASGNFSFTIRAFDNGSTGAGAPFSVSNTYTLAVAAPTITVTPATLPAATAGQAYSVSLTGAGAVAPYSFGLVGGTLPAGMTLSTTGQLAGTPTASGSFPITVQVRDANAQQGTVNLTLTVAVPTLTVTPASLPGAQFGIAYNQQLTASGGIAPYSFTVSSGALPSGMTLNATTGLLSGAPTVAGGFPFAVTVRDSTAGAAATATVNLTLQVQQRPDPALDPQVRGLVQAQGEATRRFATTQINNFQQRLDRLHERGSDDAGEGNRISVTNSLRLSLPDICRDAQVRASSARCAQQRNALSQLSGLGSSYSEAGLPTGGRSTGAGAATAAVAGTGPVAGSGGTAPSADQPRANAGSSSSGTATGTVGIWTAGIIRFGDEDAAAGRASSEFESEGITIGADYRFSPTFAAGLGVGFGRDRVDIGTQGSFSRGEAKTVALYASLLPTDGVFIDGLIGYQWLEFDLRRYVTSTGRLIDSQRSGYQWFGSVSLGADLATGAWQITPYARLDLSRARLNGYTESSGSVFDLTFLDQDVNSTTLGLGTKIRYSHDLGWARLYPELNAEYRWQLENNGDVLLTYADRLSGPYSAIRLTSLDRNELTLGTKLDLELNSGWLFGLHYITRASGGEGSDSTVKVVISHEF